MLQTYRKSDLFMGLWRVLIHSLRKIFMYNLFTELVAILLIGVKVMNQLPY